MRASLLLATLVACGGSPSSTPDAAKSAGDAANLDTAPATPAVVLAVSRADTAIVVDAFVTRGGVPATGAAVTLALGDPTTGAISAVSEQAGGHYTAQIAPAIASGNVAITASALGATAQLTAIVLPQIGSAWGQPEQVPGLVNTTGYEDSAEVSPDGQWLIVSSYSPIDLISCLLGGSGGSADDPASPACNDSLGPFTAPARPRMPGADRIVSPTDVHDELPPLGLVEPAGTDFSIALPPVGAYGFHRQADGSFAEPFVIAFGADGLTGAPFGFTFPTVPTGASSELAFAWPDILTENTPAATGNDLWHDTIALGSDTDLGDFSVGPSGAQVTRLPARVPVADNAGPQGNPYVADDGIYFDTEGGDLDIHFAAGDALGSATLAPAVTVAISQAGRGEYQPHFHAGRLYYAVDFARIVSAARTPGGDVTQAATWSAEATEVAADPGNPAIGSVASIGEPSLETHDGATTLYFVYAVRTAIGGFDVGIGRVTQAP